MGRIIDPAIISAAVAAYLAANPPAGYTHPTTHPPSIIAQDALNRFITDTEKGVYNGKQDALISGTSIKTVNGNSLLGTGNLPITAASPFTTLILSADKPTGANVTPVTLGLAFDYEINSKYLIDMYMLVAPTAATTGCGFMIDVSTVVTYVGTFVAHQLAISGTLSGSGSIGDKAVTSSGVSSGMPSTNSNFVYGGGILITGANPGTAVFFFRSETTAVTTCKAGSVIRIIKI
jgi:hypothetical protein